MAASFFSAYWPTSRPHADMEPAALGPPAITRGLFTLFCFFVFLLIWITCQFLAETQDFHSLCPFDMQGVDCEHKLRWPDMHSHSCSDVKIEVPPWSESEHSCLLLTFAAREHKMPALPFTPVCLNDLTAQGSRNRTLHFIVLLMSEAENNPPTNFLESCRRFFRMKISWWKSAIRFPVLLQIPISFGGQGWPEAPSGLWSLTHMNMFRMTWISVLLIYVSLRHVGLEQEGRTHGIHILCHNSHCPLSTVSKTGIFSFLWVCLPVRCHSYHKQCPAEQRAGEKGVLGSIEKIYEFSLSLHCLIPWDGPAEGYSDVYLFLHRKRAVKGNRKSPDLNQENIFHRNNDIWIERYAAIFGDFIALTESTTQKGMEKYEAHACAAAATVRSLIQKIQIFLFALLKLLC